MEVHEQKEAFLDIFFDVEDLLVDAVLFRLDRVHALAPVLDRLFLLDLRLELLHQS